MKKNLRNIAITTLLSTILLLSSLGLASCAGTDVVGQVAVTSFDALVQKLDSAVSYNQMDKAWELDSPAGDALKVALDFARLSNNGSHPDLELEFSAAPFLKAGLDISKLPNTAELYYLVEDGKFMLHADWGDNALKPIAGEKTVPTLDPANAKAGILATFKQIIATYRDRIGYHEKLDHYGIAVGDGNMVEWAKDMGTNDKDLVFVLNPEPLIAAGLDPAKLSGWVFAQVEIKDANGKTQLVDKLLKPFSL